MNSLLRAKRESLPGFTLIELLVVIVVIAILVAVTFVTYAGLQVRTQNTKTLANVTQYYSALQVYKIRNGTYPIVPGESPGQFDMVCLGVGYTNGTCGKVTGNVVSESPGVMTDLQQGSGSNINGIVNDQLGAVKSESFIGAVYGIDSTDTAHSPTGYARMIEWFLAGKNQDCKIPRSWAYNSANGNTACELDLETFPG